MKGPLEILKINYVIYRKFLGEKKYCNIHEKIWKKEEIFSKKKRKFFGKKWGLQSLLERLELKNI